MTTRDWAAEYQAKYEQRLADLAEQARVDYAAREQKRRQMREPVEPLRPRQRRARREDTWWRVAFVMSAIILILQLWEELKP